MFENSQIDQRLSGHFRLILLTSLFLNAIFLVAVILRPLLWYASLPVSADQLFASPRFPGGILIAPPPPPHFQFSEIISLEKLPPGAILIDGPMFPDWTDTQALAMASTVLTISDQPIDRTSRLLKMVEPLYPAIANDHDQTVTLYFMLSVNEEGRVNAVGVAPYQPGAAPFKTAAVKAIKQWQYSPRMEQGYNRPFFTMVTIHFKKKS